MLLSNSKVMVIGAQGMLGQEISLLLQGLEVDLTLADLKPDALFGAPVLELDILDVDSLRANLEAELPDVVINCAAFTNVDLAQTEPFTALQVNAQGPKNIAKAVDALSKKCLLVHFSTDYVFGGGKHAQAPIKETDSPLPCGMYGMSKLLGDELVQAILPSEHLIIRTSWLHGPKGKNFLETILTLSHEREELKVVNDQFGSPSYAPWLAQVTLDLISADARGLFNASSQGEISWFDFAKEIVHLGKGSAKVSPQTTEELGRPAPRPAYSVLDCAKLESFLGRPVISWQECVKFHIESIQRSN